MSLLRRERSQDASVIVTPAVCLAKNTIFLLISVACGYNYFMNCGKVPGMKVDSDHSLSCHGFRDRDELVIHFHLDGIRPHQSVEIPLVSSASDAHPHFRHQMRL